MRSNFLEKISKKNLCIAALRTRELCSNWRSKDFFWNNFSKKNEQIGLFYMSIWYKNKNIYNMKKLISICLLLTMSFAVKAQDQEHKSYYDNGQLKSIRKITDGKSNGECKFYFENGQLEQIGIFIDNKQNGEWKYYHENGKLDETYNYDKN